MPHPIITDLTGTSQGHVLVDWVVGGLSGSLTLLRKLNLGLGVRGAHICQQPVQRVGVRAVQQHRSRPGILARRDLLQDADAPSRGGLEVAAQAANEWTENLHEHKHQRWYDTTRNTPIMRNRVTRKQRNERQLNHADTPATENGKKMIG